MFDFEAAIFEQSGEIVVFEASLMSGDVVLRYQ